LSIVPYHPRHDVLPGALFVISDRLKEKCARIKISGFSGDKRDLVDAAATMTSQGLSGVVEDYRLPTKFLNGVT
jgi:hypothetical protein